MKLTIIILLCIALTNTVLAQPTTGTATFNKRSVTAIKLTLPYPEAAVTSGFENRMQDFGKSKKMKDYLQYKSIQVPEISNQPMTIYLKAEKTSKKDEQSELTFLIADEFDRFFSPQENPELFASATSFITAFEEPAAAANLEMQIKMQEDMVKKADQKLSSSLSSRDDYEKQKKKIEDKIADNQKDIENLEKELADQKQKLEVLTGKRKT